jgi:hypothetical protein
MTIVILREKPDDICHTNIAVAQPSSAVDVAPGTTNGQLRTLCETARYPVLEWACEELNLGPHAYQACALTT